MNSRRPKLDRMCLPGLRTAHPSYSKWKIAVRGSVAYFAVHRETTLEGRLVAPSVSAGMTHKRRSVAPKQMLTNVVLRTALTLELRHGANPAL